MKAYDIELLQSVKDGSYLYLTFRKPKDLTFEDGQYGVFQHKDKDIEGRKVRAFSFASSDSEDTLLIGTKLQEPISSFKQEMLALAKGDVMVVNGPTGRFTLVPDTPKVFLAGGIGITPIRSMIVGLSDYKDTTLIFSEANQHYPFLDDVNQLDINLHLVSGVEETADTIEQVVNNQLPDTYYYLAGSPSFVRGITTQLEELGVATDRIKFDRFTGY